MKNTFSLSESQANEIVQSVLVDASKQGASAAEVNVSSSQGFELAVRSRAIDTLEFIQDAQLNLTVYCGQKSGSVSTSSLTKASLKAVVKKALIIARYVEKDPCSGLADADCMAINYVDCDLYHPWSIRPSEAIRLSLECEAIACQGKNIHQCEEVSFNTMEDQITYGNTHNFIGSYKKTHHSMTCSLIAKEQEQMKSDYEYTLARDSTQLAGVKNLALNAVKKTQDRLGARKIKTQKCPVVFLAPQARGILGSFLSAISGGNLYRKTSFLVDCLDKKIFPSFISLVQKPHIAKALGSLPFDSEGVATLEKIFVEDGYLKSYLLNSYSARRLGMQTTGNCGGVQNLLIDAGKHDLHALLKKMNKGLLITGLMGQGVNLTTGDYSRGAHGFWVDEGEIQFPVEGVTVAGNLADMFKQMVCVGNDVDCRGRIQTGSILLESMMVAGD